MLMLHSLLDLLPPPDVAAVLVGLYFLPSIVAVIKRGPNWIPALAVNIGLGWTVIGWILALAWAFSDGKDTPPHQIH
jgi:Superinfection immunity protein